jgi:protein arginine kinase
MRIEELLTHTGEWLRGKGPLAHIVTSSRVRLARNLATQPFPNRADKKDLDVTLKVIEKAIGDIELLKGATLFRMNELDQIDRQMLVERHLMSHEHASNPEGKAVLVSNEEIVSIMVNEEDHLRIQVMRSGLNLVEAFDIIDAIDDELSTLLPFAYDEQWGYLTACPTNTGTAMRGSVMMHLPALVMTKQINKVLSAISKLSFASRGFYGEGTQALGNFYQISNQVSLGHAERDILANINGLIKQVIDQEEQARQALLLQNKPMLEDKICRSWGLLRNARIMSSQEAVELFSMVRLGIDMGLIKEVNHKALNELFIMIQPAHLQKIEGKRLNAFERDTKRASVIRQKLGGSHV